MAMLFFLSPILSQALTSSQENKCPQPSLQKPMTVNVFFAVYSEMKGNHDTPDGESIEQQRQRESIQKYALEPTNNTLSEQLGVQLNVTWKFLNYDESKNANGETPCTGKELNMGRDGSVNKELNWFTNELYTNQEKFGQEEHFAMFVLFAKCNTGTFDQQIHVNRQTASVILLDDNIQKNGEKYLIISFLSALGLQKTRFLDNKGNVQFSNEKKAAMCNDLALLLREVPDAFHEVQVKSTTLMPFEQAAVEEEGNGPTLFTAGIENSEKVDVCTQPRSVGGICGPKTYNHFFFNSKTGVCESLHYHGCGGNLNRFASEEECKNRCAKTAGGGFLSGGKQQEAVVGLGDKDIAIKEEKKEEDVCNPLSCSLWCWIHAGGEEMCGNEPGCKWEPGFVGNGDCIKN